MSGKAAAAAKKFTLLAAISVLLPSALADEVISFDLVRTSAGARNSTPLPGPAWYRQPERHPRHYLLSLARNPVQQHSISKAATEEFVGME